MKTIKYMALLLSTFLLQFPNAVALSGDDKVYQYGIEFYKKGHYGGARDMWEPIAEKGHLSAQISLAGLYFEGKGIEQDYSQAYKWYKKAADQGAAGAQYYLGLMHEQGLGVEKNYDQAVFWYEKAVMQGHLTAKDRLENLTQQQVVKLNDFNYEQAAECAAIYFIEYEKGNESYVDQFQSMYAKAEQTGGKSGEETENDVLRVSFELKMNSSNDEIVMSQKLNFCNAAF